MKINNFSTAAEWVKATVAERMAFVRLAIVCLSDTGLKFPTAKSIEKQMTKRLAVLPTEDVGQAFVNVVAQHFAGIAN